MSNAPDHPAFTVLTLVNDRGLYDDMRGSLVKQDDQLCIQWIDINADERGWAAARALNHGLEEARGTWVVIAHQDVLFPDGWWQQVSAQIKRWSGRPAVVGLMGATRRGQLRGHVHDPRGHHRWGPLPAPVVTIDEHVVILRRHYGLRFDTACPGFHCYGADIALQAASQRLPVIAVDAPVVHRSAGTIDASFRRSAAWITAKWGRQLGGTVPTCAENIHGSSILTLPRRLACDAHRRFSIARRESTAAPRLARSTTPDGLTPVVIVSHYFPPMGGAGTQRFAKFVKWLPAHGFRPIVIAAGQKTCRSAPRSDATLEDSLPPEAIVYRVHPDGARRPSWPDRLARLARCDLDAEAWVDAAESVVLSAAFRHNARCIITTVSPYAASRLGRSAQAHLGIPWLLDLRDPWALDPWRAHAPGPSRAVDLWRMRRALSDADLVIASTPASRRRYVSLAALDPDRAWTIPNGFDPCDFSQAKTTRGDRFRIVHVGTLHSVNRADYHRWAPDVESDPTARTGRYLLKALAHLREHNPDRYRHITVDLVGQVHSSHFKLARSLGVEDRLNEVGYLPHRAALSVLQKADAIFVPLHRTPGEPLVVPGKLYEAIASERYVIAAMPEGDGTRLLESCSAGCWCPPDEPIRLASQLGDLIADWHNGTPRRGAARADLTSFTREHLTGMLADAMHSVIEGTVRRQRQDPWDALEQAGRIAAAA